MRLWRRTSSEMAGAWRSFRYDMGRRPFESPADGPDVTSTGMNTFGGPAWESGSEPIELPVAGPPPEPRRRARTASAFGLLTVIGAAGAYLVVVNGLVPVRDETPAAAGTMPAAPPAVAAASGLGPSKPLHRRTASTPGRESTVAPPGGLAVATPADRPAPGDRPTPGDRPATVAPAPRHARPVRTAKPINPKCQCDDPPVPTPTAPAAAPSATPSAPAWVNGWPNGWPSGWPSDWDTSGRSFVSLEPRGRWQSGHHRRAH